jgi:Protein of unknown function (DUF3072)
MRTGPARHHDVAQRLVAPMTRAQALRLRTLSEEAYQPKMFADGLTTAEADRRITALNAEIELANSF